MVGAGEGGSGEVHKAQLDLVLIEHLVELEAVSALAPSQARRRHTLKSKYADH